MYIHVYIYVYMYIPYRPPLFSPTLNSRVPVGCGCAAGDCLHPPTFQRGQGIQIYTYIKTYAYIHISA